MDRVALSTRSLEFHEVQDTSNTKGINKAIKIRKEGPILKYGHRFGSSRMGRIEHRWMKLTETELSYSVAREAKGSITILIKDVVSVFTKDVLRNEVEAGHVEVPAVETESDQNKVLFKSIETCLNEEDFVVITSRVGRHGGKHFAFKTTSVRARDEWVDAIKLLLRDRKNLTNESRSMLVIVHQVRNRLKLLLSSDDFQTFVVAMVVCCYEIQTYPTLTDCWMQILLNFLLNIIECQLLPSRDSAEYATLNALDVFFTILFSAELVLKMAAIRLLDLVVDPWNLFDLSVVATSWVLYSISGMNQDIVFLRIVRALRVAGFIRRIQVFLANPPSTPIHQGDSFMAIPIP